MIVILLSSWLLTLFMYKHSANNEDNWYSKENNLSGKLNILSNLGPKINESIPIIHISRHIPWISKIKKDNIKQGPPNAIANQRIPRNSAFHLRIILPQAVIQGYERNGYHGYWDGEQKYCAYDHGES